MNKIKKIYEDIPLSLRRFLIRGSLIFVAWSLLYQLLLKPSGIPDEQLSNLIVWGTAKLMSLFYSHITTEGANVLMNGKVAIFIASSCNGLELIVLYIGFMLCLPTTAKRFWSFTIIGTIIICFCNMIRCMILASMFYFNYTYANFAHHYFFDLVMYALIFYGWILYAKKYNANAKI